MHKVLSSFCVALLLAGCSFIVTVDDASYRVSVRPLVPSPTDTPSADGATVAVGVRLRQKRTTGNQWRKKMKRRNLKTRITQLEAENEALRERLLKLVQQPAVTIVGPYPTEPYPMTTETWPPPRIRGPLRTGDGWILDYAPITIC